MLDFFSSISLKTPIFFSDSPSSLARVAQPESLQRCGNVSMKKGMKDINRERSQTVRAAKRLASQHVRRLVAAVLVQHHDVVPLESAYSSPLRLILVASTLSKVSDFKKAEILSRNRRSTAQPRERKRHARVIAPLLRHLLQRSLRIFFSRSLFRELFSFLSLVKQTESRYPRVSEFWAFASRARSSKTRREGTRMASSIATAASL